MLHALLAQARQPDVCPFIGGLIIGLLIACLIGAVLLRASCALYNKFVGDDPDKTVPSPEFGKATGIFLATMVVNWVVGYACGFMLGMQATALGWSKQTLNLVVQLVSTPISLIVMAAMLTAMLPTTFQRGIMVALCQLLIMIGIAVFIFLLMMMTRGLWN